MISLSRGTRLGGPALMGRSDESDRIIKEVPVTICNVQGFSITKTNTSNTMLTALAQQR